MHVTVARAQDTPHRLYTTFWGRGIVEGTVARTGGNTQSNHNIKIKIPQKNAYFCYVRRGSDMNNTAYVPLLHRFSKP